MSARPPGTTPGTTHPDRPDPEPLDQQASSDSPEPTPRLRDAHRYNHLVERCACGAWAWTPSGCGTCIALAAKALTDRAGSSLDRARRNRAADLAERLHAANIHRRDTGAA